jgi:hypothetical protein
VGFFEKKFPLQIMGKGLFGKEKMRDEALEKLFITRVTRTTEREALILGKKAKEPSEGLRLSLREGEVSRITVIRVDENENPTGEAHVLQGKDAGTAQRLWAQVVETVMELVEYRSKLLQVAMYGKPVTELESPATVALAMIQSVAPLVRDLARHSPSSTELALKRDLGDGKREELFISYKEIIDKYDQLKPRYREMFDVFGLEERTAVKPQKKQSSYPPAQQQIPASWSMAPPPVAQSNTPGSMEMPHGQLFPSVPPAAAMPHFPAPAPIPAEALGSAAGEGSGPGSHHTPPAGAESAPFVDVTSYSGDHSAPSVEDLGYQPAPQPPPPPPQQPPGPPPPQVALPAPSAPPPRHPSSHPPSGPAPRGGEAQPASSPASSVALPKPSTPPPKRGPKAAAS